MKIAVVGCSHGKLDQIYNDVKASEIDNGFPIDLIIICGDLQAARNQNDLKCMAIPDKLKELGDFHQYYLGKKTASHLTLVIGGNEEASNYFQSLPYGGWIAYNIYYMGYSSVVKYKGVRIGGISGIYNKSSITKGYYESLPYDEHSIKSVYYTRYLEVFKMLQLNDKLDVLFTHDWPSEIYKEPKIKEKLMKKKKSLKNEIEENRLGNPLFQIILDKLKPKHWFAAHYHINIKINYSHHQSSNNKTDQQDETVFIALDKCKEKKSYLEIVNIKSDEFNLSPLEYDLEWLAILKFSNKFVSIQKNPSINVPRPDEFINFDLDDLKVEIEKIFEKQFKIPVKYDFNLKPINSNGDDLDPNRKTNFTNEQTTKFCEKLGLTDPISLIINLINGKVNNPSIINIDSDDSDNEWNSDDETNVKKNKNINQSNNKPSLTNSHSNGINFKPNNQSIQNNLKISTHLINNLFDNQKLNNLSNGHNSLNVNIKSEKYDPISSSSDNETTISDNQIDNNNTISQINQFKVRSISSYIKSENNLSANETLDEPLNNENLNVPMTDGDILEDPTENYREFTNNIKKEKYLNEQFSTGDTFEETTNERESTNIKKEKYSNEQFPTGDTFEETTNEKGSTNIKKEKYSDGQFSTGDKFEETTNERESTNIKKEKYSNEQFSTGDTLEESTSDSNVFKNIKKENKNYNLDELDEPFKKRIKTEKQFF